MAQSAIALAECEPVAPWAPEVAAGDLMELSGPVTGGRPRQGRDHPVAAVPALAATAAVAGMKGYTAITHWVKDAPPPVLADLYKRAGASPTGRRRSPRSGGLSPMPTRRFLDAIVAVADQQPGCRGARRRRRR